MPERVLKIELNEQEFSLNQFFILASLLPILNWTLTSFSSGLYIGAVGCNTAFWA